MLYNICEVERTLGLSDISDDEFIDECERVPNVFHEKGSFPRDLKKIARYTATSPLYIIEHDDYADRIDIICGSANEHAFWNRIYSHLDKPGIQCVHIGCMICIKKDSWFTGEEKDECHIFLISIVKMANGATALYLLDNMNREVSRDTQELMYRHVEYIHDNIFD